MDISSIYTNMYLDQTQTNAATSKVESSVNKDYSSATEEELMEACKEFEAYFVEQMFKALEATSKVPGDDEESSSSSTLEMFSDQLHQEYAAQATESQDFGIAQMLFEQMKRNYDL